MQEQASSQVAVLSGSFVCIGLMESEEQRDIDWVRESSEAVNII
jgi:hypothetical protein